VAGKPKPKHKVPHQPSGSSKTKRNPTLEELNKVLGPARDAQRAREALCFPTRFAASSRDSLREVVDARLREAQRQSKSLQAFAGRVIDARAAAIKALSGPLTALQGYEALDRPTGIIRVGDLKVPDGRPWSHIASKNSWAKVKYYRYSTDSSPTWLIFCYFFQNSATHDIVVTAYGHIVLNGLAAAYSHPGQHGSTGLYLNTWLAAYDYPVMNPTLDDHIDSTRESAVSVSSFYDGGASSATVQNVFRTFLLPIENVVVKAGSAKVFDVILSFQCSIGDGVVDADFLSGDFQVTSPWLGIATTS
jgi:hypothetical protein